MTTPSKERDDVGIETAPAKEPAKRKLPRCSLCAGTGWLWLMNSWFMEDGLRRERCAICGGSGASTHRCAVDYVSQQKRLRERATARAPASFLEQERP